MHRMQHAFRPRHVAAACALALAGPAVAVDLPSAGSLLQDLRPPAAVVPRPDAPVLPQAEPLRAPMTQGDGVRLRVERVRVTGATVFPAGQLQALVQDAAGQELDFAGLEALAARISRFYRQRGYTVARAYLPQQDIRDGVVEIAVLEGRFDAISVHRAGGVEAPLPLAALAPGQVVTDAALERSLLLASDVPGIAVRSTLQPGASVGTSELVVDVVPGDRYTGALEADNFGSRSTGHARAGGTVNVNDATGRGDLATLKMLTSEGLNYLRAGYQLPVGAAGTRAGVAWSGMHYRLGREFEPLDANGTARIATVFVAHPLLRSRAANVNLQLSVEDKQLRDRVDAVSAVTDKSVHLLNLGLSGDWRDAWAGGGVTVLSATFTHGDLDIESAAARAVDEVSARTAGGYGKFSLAALREQVLGPATTLQAAFTGQWADKNLDASEKLSLGGVGGVRAYPQGEAPSDRAGLLTVELRQAIAPGWQLQAFVDAAHGALNAQPYPGAPADNRRTLRGAGLGLAWTGPDGWYAGITYAQRLGDEPSTAEPDRRERVWLQASRRF